MCNASNLVAWFVHSADGTNITTCTATTTDAVQIRCHVEFDPIEVGQQFYVRMIAKINNPDGTLNSYYTYYTSSITAPSAYDFRSTDLPLIPGTWIIYVMEVYQGVYPSGTLACSGPSPSGECEVLTIGGTITCDTPTGCMVSGPTNITQGQTGTFTADWTGGNAPFTADFYLDGSYYKSATSSVQYASITVDSTALAAGGHQIGVNVWYNCATGGTPSCTSGYTGFNVVSSCTIPLLSFSLT